MNENNRKPIIGLTTNKSERNSTITVEYIDSIFAAGGIPICIPTIISEENFDYYLKLIDGLLLTGGGDISPSFYGEEPIKEVNSLSTYKDGCEKGLFKRAYERKMPILGICRGSQFINVALGGNLYQDINAQVPGSYGHSPKSYAHDELYHSVEILKQTRLHEIMGEDTMLVNSFHHQAVKAIGKNLVVAAVSKDNIIEAVESTEDRFLIGVQWHPECLTAKYPEFLKIFKSFTDAATAYSLVK